MNVLQTLLNGLTSGGLYCLITIGFALIYSVARFFDLSHGATFLVGGYIGYSCIAVLKLPLVPSFLLASLGAALFGYILEKILFRRLWRKKASSLVFFIATLGVLIIVQSLISIIFKAETKVFRSGASPPLQVFGLKVTRIQLAELVTSILILFGIWWMLKRTILGKRIQAIANSQELATIVGVPVRKTVRYVILAGAALSGLAGCFFGLERTMNPMLGLFAVLAAIVASIIGGVGSVSGAALGAFILGMLENIAVMHALFSDWKKSIVFLVLILFLLVRPEGLLFKKYRSA